MGLFSRLKSNSSNSDTASTMTESSTAPLTFSNSSDPSTTTEPPRKKSLYAKYQDLKRGPSTSAMTDEELFRATGKTREEFDAWKQTAPGVAGGQAAGSITAGGNSGLGTAFGTGEGLGGWGFEAGRVPDRDGKDRVVR